MNTISYYFRNEKPIEIGDELYFGQLWDGEGNGNELLESGAISPDNEGVVTFEIVERDNENICDSLVKVVAIDE